MERVIEALTFQHIWGVEIMIAKWSIISLSLALLYYSMYLDYKKIRDTSGEAVEKWMSPILFALIIFFISYILDVTANLIETFSYITIYSIIFNAAIFIIPIISMLIYRSQYKRHIEGKVDKTVLKKSLSPWSFGLFALLISAMIHFGYYCIMATGV